MCVENFYIGFLILTDITLVVLLIVSQIAYRKEKRKFINQLNSKKW